jgi:hypothetical protein
VRSPIDRAIIDYDKLQIIEGLGHDTFDRFTKKLGPVTDSHDHGDKGLCHVQFRLADNEKGLGGFCAGLKRQLGQPGLALISAWSAHTEKIQDSRRQVDALRLLDFPGAETRTATQP